jgi:hypothetical protein
MIDLRAVLEDIYLDNGELETIKVEMIPSEELIPGRNFYGLNIEQYLITESGERLVGGQTLVIKDENH